MCLVHDVVNPELSDTTVRERFNEQVTQSTKRCRQLGETLDMTIKICMIRLQHWTFTIHKADLNESGFAPLKSKQDEAPATGETSSLKGNVTVIPILQDI